MTEHFGIIIKLDGIKNYGFVNSITDQCNYYFRLSAVHGHVNLNDSVAFLVETRNDKLFACAIRKIYQNARGVKFIPRINYNHIHENPDFYLPLIMDKIIESENDFIIKEFEFDTTIGKTICVQTNETDLILYAIRKGRSGHTRFVINRAAMDCCYLTIVLMKVETHYIIISLFVGRISAPEPWDEKAALNDLEFWNAHALIYGSVDIIEGSETTLCPWILNMHSLCKIKTSSAGI